MRTVNKLRSKPPTRVGIDRPGLASLEVVMTTGIAVPLAFAFFFVAYQFCRELYGLMASVIGWPYL